MLSFIQPTDYSVLITDEQLAQITTEQSDIDTCILQSEEEIKEYLRHRFDVDFDMRVVTTPADPATVTALKDARLYDGTAKLYYLCIADATAQPLTNTAFFTQIDDRNQKLVQITIDVFLYHLHTRLNPRNIPTHRKIRYDGDGDIQKSMNAIKWLTMVQKGTIAPNLTVILDDDGEQLDSGQSIIYGNSKINIRGANRNFTGF
ncbi:unnamed protein product [marine sediment metagenome]|uniref:Uncharacterized protein n=1 Tax=marine sediment metagenome TaxID=412755 RepID=X0SKT5_9ZZZZ